MVSLGIGKRLGQPEQIDAGVVLPEKW